MAYDLPFMTSAQRRAANLRPTTEEESDYAAAPRAPRVWEPDIPTPGLSLPSTPPTMADRISQFEAQSPYATRPATLSAAEADVLGATVNRFVPPSIDPTRVGDAGIPTATVEAAPETPLERGERVRLSPEVEQQQQLERLGIEGPPEPGSIAAELGWTEPPGLRDPIDFQRRNGIVGEIEAVGLGLLYTAGQFMEPFVQPIDVAAETIIEVASAQEWEITSSGLPVITTFSGQTPTVFSEGGGYNAALDKFRDRPWYIQLAASGGLEAGITAGAAPFFKALSLSSKATGVTNLAARAGIRNGANGINIVPTRTIATSSGKAVDDSAVRLVQKRIDDASKICFSECINEIGPNVLGLRNVNPGLSRSDALDDAIRKVVSKPPGINIVRHHDLTTPIYRHAQEKRSVLDSMANTTSAKIGHIAKQIFPDTNDRQLIPSLAGIDDKLAKEVELMPSINDVAARLDIFAPHLSASQMEGLMAIKKLAAPWRELIDEVEIPLGSRRDVTGNGFYLPRGELKEIQEEFSERIRGVSGVGGGKQGFEKAERFPSMSRGVASGELQYASIGDAMNSYIHQVGSRSIDVHTANQVKRLKSETGAPLADTAAQRLDRSHPTLRRDVTNLRNNVRSNIQSIRSQEAAARVTARQMGAAQAEATEAGARTAAAKERLEGLEPSSMTVDKKTAKNMLDEAHNTRDEIHSEIKLIAKDLRETKGKLDNVEAAWVAAALDNMKDLGFAEDYTRFIDNALMSPVEGYYTLIDKIADMNDYLGELVTLRNKLASRVDDLIDKESLYRELSDDARSNLLDSRKNKRLTETRELAIRGVKGEIKVLEMEGRRAGRRAAYQEKTYGKRIDRLVATSEKIDTLRTSLDEKNDVWQRAIESSRDLPEGRNRIDLPGLQGQDFPVAMANAVNNLIKSDKPLTGKGAFLVNLVSDLNGLYLGLKATADDSVLFIQGLPGLVGTRGKGKLGAVLPAAASKEFLTLLDLNVRAWADPDVLGAFIFNFDEAAGKAGRLVSEEWASYGLRAGGTNTEFALGRGTFKGVENIPKVGSFVKGANRAFGYFGDAKRLQFADDMLAEELSKGRSLQNLIDSGDMARIAEISNNMTGWSRHRVAGNLGDLVLLAPRYFASRLETVFKGAMGMIPVPTRNGMRWGAKLDQRMARRTMLRLLTGSMMMTYSINKMQGKDTDFRPIVNGRWNPNFNRINAFGRDISLLGPYDSLARLLVSIGTTDIGVVRGMTSGTVSNIWDFASGSTYEGFDVDWKSPKDWGKQILSAFTPFSMEEGSQSVLQGAQRAIDHDWKGAAESGAGIALEFVGAKSSLESMSDMKQSIADEIMTNLSKDDPAKYKRIMDSMDMSPYDKLSGHDYLFDHLPAEIRSEAAKDPRILEMKEELPDRLPDIQTRVNVALNDYDLSKKKHVDDLAMKITSGMKGILLKSAVQEYKSNMFLVGQTLFQGDVREELEKNEPKNLIDGFRNRYWNIELKVDNPQLGTLDYDQRDAERADILQEAAAAGILESDITVRMPTGNAAVDTVLNQYHTDMDTLRPMWEVDEKVLRMVSPFERIIWERYKRLDQQNAGDFREANSAVSRVEKAIKNARMAMRREDDRIDVAYVRQYEVTPVTMAGLKEEAKMKAMSASIGMVQ